MKKFMIIRQELNAPQPGLFLGFDQLGQLGRGHNTDGNGSGDGMAKGDPKKKWSLLGKVFSMNNAAGGNQHPDAAWDEEFRAARRETAESRSRAGSGLPPSKSSNFSNHKNNQSSDDDSLCSAPTFEEQKHVFKFILAWQHQAAPPRDRILTRPRLPIPAQARINSQNRSDTPPTPTRQFSGSLEGGLISGARNASPMSSSSDSLPRRLSLKLEQSSSLRSDLSLTDLDEDSIDFDAVEKSPAPSPPAGESARYTDRFGDAIVHPVKPRGFHTKNAIYTGRALAEWSHVVFECNNFVERRRSEGIINLGDVEIPILGVEGFRKVGS